jgi:hypothetical protein
MLLQRLLRFRYSLRALLVFITLFALWGGYHGNRAWRERKAELVLLNADASFQYEQFHYLNGFGGRLSRAYITLVKTMWRERFITRVDINAEVTPIIAIALSELPHLESLSIAPPYPQPPHRIEPGKRHEREPGKRYEPVKIPDQWPPSKPAMITIPAGSIERILSQRRLFGLQLSNCVLSDRDLEAIGRHKTLEGLVFGQCNLTEEAFAAYLSLPRLRRFHFPECQVRGDRLHSLPGSEVLVFLGGEGAPVGPEFAAFAARCSKLENLVLESPLINDESIAVLSSHPSLQGLTLRKSQVTDKCIDTLIQMPALRGVALPYNVSEEAAARLRAARPGLRGVSRMK